jgi:hypothetical protein
VRIGAKIGTMQQPPLPDGSLPGTRPYVPTAPLPPGHVPPGATTPSDLGPIAFVAALFMLLGFPIAMLVVTFYADSPSAMAEVLTWMLVAGGVLCVATFVASLVAIARVKKGQTGRTTLSIAALVLSILAPLPIIGVWIVGIFLLAGGGGPHGRPLRRRDGRPLATPRGASDAWSAPGVAPDVDSLDAATRAALGRAWSEDASLEHASIAAFGRLALDLIALGAPPELVAGAHRAALEEVEHARVAYAIASVYAGETVGPAALPEAGVAAAESRDDRVARVVFESVVDGMVGESAAARIAALVRDRTRDPVVRVALDRVAAEESTHADLAGVIVAWCSQRCPEATSRGVERALRVLRGSVVAELSAFAPDALPGRPSPREVEIARRDAAARVSASLSPRLAAAA